MRKRESKKKLKEDDKKKEEPKKKDESKKKDDSKKGKGKGKKEESKKDTEKRSSRLGKSSGEDAKKDDGKKSEAAEAASSTAAADAAPAATAAVAASSSSSAAPPADGAVTHLEMLKKSQLADVGFQASGKTLTAHLAVLQVRCPKLAELAAGKRRNRRVFFKIVTADMSKSGHDAATLEVLLQYLYGDNIDFASLDPILVLSACIAAHQYELPRLVRLCHDHLRASISMDNVFGLLKTSDDRKEETVYKMCMNYAHANLKEFITHKDRVASLGMPLFQEVVAVGLEEYKELPVDNSPVPESSLIADFHKLFDETIGNGSAQPDSFVTISGTKIFFHKAVLGAHASGFANLAPSGKLDDLTEQLAVVSHGLTADSFTALLRYIYYGLRDVSPLVACNLAPYTAHFSLDALQEICEGHIATNLKPDNVLSVLGVAYRAENLDRDDMKKLRADGVDFVLNNVGDVSLDPLRNMDIRISVDILRHWQESAKQQK